jgi:hypothetical protein
VIAERTELLTRLRWTGWLLALAITGALLPAGGFIIALVARTRRLRHTAPPLGILLAAAGIMLALQILGIMAWTEPELTVGPVVSAD